MTQDEFTAEYWSGKGARILVRALRDGARDQEYLFSEGQATRIVLAYIDAFNSERRAINQLSHPAPDVPGAEEIEAIRARHEAAKQALDDERYYSGKVPAVFPTNEGKRAHADRATLLAHVDQLDAERKALRALCLEAAEFYGYGGTFPIRGVMAMRLTGAALGTLLTRAQGESS